MKTRRHSSVNVQHPSTLCSEKTLTPIFFHISMSYLWI